MKQRDGVTVRRRRLRPTSEKENSVANFQEDDTVTVFRTAAKRVGASALHNKELAESIISASLGRQFGFLLAENIDGAVSTCRDLIKKAASNKGKLELVLNPLIVAIHVLRACWRLERHRSNLIRLLYHATAAAADTLDVSKVADHSLMMYGMVAWETLGMVLEGFKLTVDKQRTARFKLGEHIFPVPSIQLSAKAEKCGDFTVEQFFDLGIHATLAAARIVSHSLKLKLKPCGWCNIVDQCLIGEKTEVSVSNLVLNTALPWICACAKLSPSDKTHGFAKSARNIIWKLAEKMDGEQLRMNARAVEASLLHDPTREHTIISSAIFDNACRFAAQVADVSNSRLKKMGPKDRSPSISQFHDLVGQLLDRKVKPHAAPDSYFEYCGYRDLHTQQNSQCEAGCWMRNLPSSCSHVCGASPATHTERVYGCFLVGLAIRQHLIDSRPFELDNETCELLVEGYLESIDRLPGKMKIKFCWLFAALDLHSLVRTSVELAHAINAIAQAFASRLLSECIGSLAIGSVRHVDGKQSERLFNTGVWSCIVAVSSCRDDHCRLLEKTSSLVASIPKQLQLSYAKALSSVARSRHEQHAKGALEIMRHAIRILVHFAADPTCQMANRLSLLSKIYKRAGKSEEALFSTMTGIVCDIRESALETDPQSTIDFVRGLSYLTKGLIPTESNFDIPMDQSGRINEVVRLLSRRIGTDGRSGDVSLEALSLRDAVGLVGESHLDFAESFSERCGGSFTILNVIHSLFRDFNSSEESFQYCTTSLQVLACVIASVGHVIQSQATSLPPNTVVDLFGYTADMISGSRLEESRRDLILNLVRAIASVSLVSNFAPPDFTNWSGNKATQWNHRNLITSVLDSSGLGNLENSDMSNELLQFSMAVRIALELFKTQLNIQLTEGDNEDYQITLGLILENAETILRNLPDRGVIPDLTRHCVLCVLTRLCDLRSVNGDDLRAAAIANCTFSYADDDGVLTTWLASSVLSLQAVDRISHGRLLSKRGLLRSKPATLYGTELEACDARIQACHCDDSNVPAVKNKLESLLPPNACNTTEDLISSFYSEWTKTTVQLGLFECEDRAGNVEDMLRLLLRCSDDTKRLLKRVKSAMHSKEKNLSFPECIVIPSILARCSQRRNDCLRRIALVYRNLGDHKKTLCYGLKLCRSFNVCSEADEVANHVSSSNALVRRLMSHFPQRNTSEVLSLRLLVKIVAETKPADSNSDIISPIRYLKELISAAPDSISTSKSGFETLRCVVEGLDVLNAGRIYPYQDYDGLLNASESTLLADDFKSHLPQMSYDFQFRKAAVDLTMGNALDIPGAIDTLKRLARAPDCTNTIRAGAHYILGMRPLQSARESRELVKLWEEDSSFVSRDIENARHHLLLALRLLGSTCTVLKRDVLRNLALALGPSHEVAELNYSACTLIHASIGEATCRKAARNASERDGLPSDLRWLRLFDHHEDSNKKWFFKQLGKLCPTNYRFVSFALCSSGELLIASVEFRSGGVHHSACCVFPENAPGGVVNESMQAFRSLVRKNNSQLEEVHTIDQSDREAKKEWWKQRKELDRELRTILDKLDRVILKNEMVREVVVGTPKGKNLASRFEQVVDPNGQEFGLSPDGVDEMKVPELVAELVAIGIEKKSLRGLRKADLSQLLRDERVSQVDASETKADSCLLFSLDENLQQFPIEGIPYLQGRTICRLSSVAMALAKLLEERRETADMQSLNPEKVSYILDPESNLHETQQRLEPLLQEYSSSFGGKWRGTVNEPPGTEFLGDSLTQRGGLMLYFGHGGGKKYLGSTSYGGPISTTMILMGCSSGQLRSINEPIASDGSLPNTNLEPEGVALMYLEAGAPCVVGNLWDVTDKDIDAFTVKLLASMFLDGESTATAVSDARDACKLRYLTGCSPVCYGFPVETRKRRR